MTPADAFADALTACGPSADRGAKMDLYGWLVGSWDLDVVETTPDGRTLRRPGEWHFNWALEGRAVQDVWIVPSRGAGRHADAPAHLHRYGTTLRTYDPASDTWRIQWTEPVTGLHLTQTGRREGDRIVQNGTLPSGMPIRWSFNDIAPDSFVWRSEVSPDGGATWWTNTEFTARRVAPA